MSVSSFPDSSQVSLRLMDSGEVCKIFSLNYLRPFAVKIQNCYENFGS